jgi:protein-tyrosine phosphatase
VDILPILTETYDVIREKMEKGEGVLVHCGLGVSRSGAVVVGYCKFCLFFVLR